MTLRPGTRVGVYEITGSLGAGGMGEVYRVHDATLGRDVALKILQELVVDDPCQGDPGVAAVGGLRTGLILKGGPALLRVLVPGVRTGSGGPP